MTPHPRFAVASCEELWTRGQLVEKRVSCGQAVEDEQGIVAIDAIDRSLLDACNASMAAMRRLLQPDLRMRLVAEARPGESESTIVASLPPYSVVTAPAHLDADLRLLREVASVEPRLRQIPRDTPIVWKNGTAAVLVHEAVGHPLEHGRDPLPVPSWLRINVALESRRATFSDVPLVRMRHVHVAQREAPFTLPPRRVEILLVEGGSYEPLSETVTLRIAAADLVEGDDAIRLHPFEIVESRSAIARAITGAAGEPERYPGVICSREGQELFVESSAPLLLTEFQ